MFHMMFMEVGLQSEDQSTLAAGHGYTGAKIVAEKVTPGRERQGELGGAFEGSCDFSSR